MYSYTISQPQDYMEVSGHLLTQAALSPKKDLQVLAE
jgi:hypothetical protein